MNDKTQKPNQKTTETIPDGAAIPGDPAGSEVDHDGTTGAANVNNPQNRDQPDRNAFGGEITPQEATEGS